MNRYFLSYMVGSISLIALLSVIGFFLTTYSEPLGIIMMIVLSFACGPVIKKLSDVCINRERAVRCKK